MTKINFLLSLHNKLSGLPQDDIEERLNFYSEMIEDRMEEGLLEEQAVAAIGSVDEIAAQILEEIPLAKVVKHKIKPKRQLKLWEIILLALGSPIWLSLGIAAVAVILSGYVSLWAVIISLWSVFVSLIACAVAGITAGIAVTIYESCLSGIAMISASIVCAGLSIFMFFGCMAATKGILLLTKKSSLWIKKCFVKKEEA